MENRKIKISVFFVLCLSLFILIGCNAKTSTSTSTSFGLQISDSTLAKSVNGEWQPVRGSQFSKGDTIGLILSDVGKFERENGINKVEMQLRLISPGGKVILDKKELLGAKGHREFSNNIASSLVGKVTTTPRFKTGEYTLTVKVIDEVSGSTASKSTTFSLE